jgi:hypothetical protein
MGKACNTNGGEYAYRILVGKPEDQDVGGWAILK